MNKEIKDKWIAALESGKFKQGTQNLFHRQEKTYCCLGVLQSVCRKDGKRIQRVLDDEHLRPESCQRIADLSLDEQEVLWRMNDDGKTFAEIAQFIRDNL